MTGLIPEPPPGEPADWTALVGAYLARGVYGVCVICSEGTYDHWDLTHADQSPVIDRSGTLTDQVPLHPRCIRGLVEHWAMLTGPDGPGDVAEAPDPVPGAVRSDPFEQRQPRRARTGAYARRGGNR